MSSANSSTSADQSSSSRAAEFCKKFEAIVMDPLQLLMTLMGVQRLFAMDEARVIVIVLILLAQLCSWMTVRGNPGGPQAHLASKYLVPIFGCLLFGLISASFLDYSLWWIIIVSTFAAILSVLNAHHPQIPKTVWKFAKATCGAMSSACKELFEKFSGILSNLVARNPLTQDDSSVSSGPKNGPNAEHAGNIVNV